MKHWLPILVIAAATLLVYGQTITHEFLTWDDDQLIISNPHVNPPTWAGATSAWGGVYQHLYIPLTYNAWALLGYAGESPVPDESGNRLNPYLFHAGNVAVHVCGALLVFGIAVTLLKQRWAAAVAALFWAIHPLQVEPVAWATGMKDVLSGVLALLSVYLYLRAADKKGRYRQYLVAAACLLVASFAKPGIVSVPVIVGGLDLLWLRRPWRQVSLSVIPMLLAVIPATIATSIAQPTGDLHLCSLWQRPLIAGHAIAFYLGKLVWPAKLVIDYGMSPARVLASPWGYLAWLVPVAVSVGVLAWRPGRRPLGAAWLVFLAGVAPVLGLMPFVFQYYSTVADRYVYLALLGPALAFGWVLGRLPVRAAVVLAVAIPGALAVRGFVQAQSWADSQSLLEHTLAGNPRSYLAHSNLGALMINEGELLRRQGEAQAGAKLQERGEVELRKALEIWPDYPAALNMLSVYYLKTGRTAEALDTRQEAVDAYDKLPRALTESLRMRVALAQACLKNGRREQAIANLEAFLARNPGDTEANALLREAKATP